MFKPSKKIKSLKKWPKRNKNKSPKNINFFGKKSYVPENTNIRKKNKNSEKMVRTLEVENQDPEKGIKGSENMTRTLKKANKIFEKLLISPKKIKHAKKKYLKKWPKTSKKWPEPSK